MENAMLTMETGLLEDDEKFFNLNGPDDDEDDFDDDFDLEEVGSTGDYDDFDDDDL